MVLVNPRSASLWQSHVILNGRGRDYHVGNFPGPMSIKTVLRGTAVWQTEEGRFEIGPGSCLVINDRQPYSITVESKELVGTFCVFFAAGFVEDIQRTMTSSDLALLDDPVNNLRLEFEERLPTNDCVLTPLLRALHRTRDEEGILRLAEALVTMHEVTINQASKLQAAKLSTRVELLRRVHPGRNVIEGSLSQPLALYNVARQAALSPYHFHRSFTQLFGETPYAYITRRRMEHAADLLKNSNMAITDICFVCGYQSLASFCSLFRKYTGATPKQFRATD